MRRLVILSGVLAGLTGCSVFTGPDTRRVVGLIDAFGSSGCTTPDGVGLTLTPTQALVTPYDLVATGEVVCPADFAPRPHPVELRFTAVGTATIVASGQVFDRNGPGRIPGTVTRQLVVLP